MKYKVTESRDTFAVEDLLSEDKLIELKARLLGYEVEKIKTSNKNSDKPKLK